MRFTPTDTEDNAPGHARALADSVVLLAEETYNKELDTKEPSALTFRITASKALKDFTTEYYEEELADTRFAERPDGLTNQLEELGEQLAEDVENHVTLTTVILEFTSDDFLNLLKGRLRLTVYDALAAEHTRNNVLDKHPDDEFDNLNLDV